MDDIERLYEHQTMMAVSIYSFLDNLLSALRSRPPSPPTVQLPQIQVGGYPEDLFFYLSDKEKDEFNCSICFSIVRNAHQCQNKHLFCYNCILVWSKTPGGGHDRCPMCRADGLYAKNEDVIERLNRKRVMCSAEGCNWRGYLRGYDEHDHRHYEPSEIDLPIELPAISPKFTSNISTSDFLRQMNAASGESDSAGPPESGTVSRPAPRTVARRQSSTEPSVSRRPVRRPDPLVRRPSGPTTATNNPTANRPGMIPRPPTTPRPANSRSVRTGTNTVARRSSQPNRVTRPTPSAARAALSESSTTVASSDQSNVATNNSSAVPAPSAETSEASEGRGEARGEENGPSNNQSSDQTNSQTRIQTNSQTNVEANGSQDGVTSSGGLEYHRLGQPPPPRHPMTDRLSHGRDQLFVLMTLMSYELEERRRAIEQFQSSSVERERVRLQQLSEVQTLNRRLTLVTNNLSRLLDARNNVLSGTNNIRVGLNRRTGTRPRLSSPQDSSDSDDNLPPRLL